MPSSCSALHKSLLSESLELSSSSTNDAHEFVTAATVDGTLSKIFQYSCDTEFHIQMFQ
jgi:hypothetical protein